MHNCLLGSQYYLLLPLQAAVGLRLVLLNHHLRSTGKFDRVGLLHDLTLLCVAALAIRALLFAIIIAIDFRRLQDHAWGTLVVLLWLALYTAKFWSL